MNNILIWTNHRRWQKAARTIVYTASLLMLLGAAPAAAAKTCKKLIKACGCTAKKGHLTLANDLTSSSPSADCVTISGAHVVLDMAGHKITGPGGAATGAGIHVLAQGNGAFIDGVNQPISNFGTGILVEASDVVMAFVELRSNAQFGLKINGGSRNSMYNSDAGNESIASSGNGDTGVLITNGNDNLIDDIFASHNAKYGIHVSGGTNNSLHDLARVSSIPPASPTGRSACTSDAHLPAESAAPAEAPRSAAKWSRNLASLIPIRWLEFRSTAAISPTRSD